MIELENRDYLCSIVREICHLPCETEWIERKRNNGDPQKIGEYISALANSAALMGRPRAYLLWGFDEESSSIVGTEFAPSQVRIGNEELESWLLRHLEPKIEFLFQSLEVEEKPVVLLEISSAEKHPTQFSGVEYIRIGSYKKKLKEYPEKERALWRRFDGLPFEKRIAERHLSSQAVVEKLDFPAYFSLLKMPLPDSRSAILESLVSGQMIVRNDAGSFDITNMGGMLFAKDLNEFHSLRRKAVRVILYEGSGRTKAIREFESQVGYAAGFEEIIEKILTWTPSNEIIGRAFRREVPMFPEPAIREVVANAIIHQDFHLRGTGVMVEVFSDRIEVTNPGPPLIKTDRFLDSPPYSRNELLASLMRRIGICEERGTGIDKVIISIEAFQLPAPVFEVTDHHTRVILFAYKKLGEMDRSERVRATYLHCCLKYVQNQFMTNPSLRERFGIEQKESFVVSRIIREAIEAGMVVNQDPSASRRLMKYLPFWASPR